MLYQSSLIFRSV